MIHTVKYLDTEVKMKVSNPYDHIQKNWLNGNFYETHRNGMLNDLYNRYSGGMILDVGACVGNHTIFFSKVLKAPVVAMEPNVDNYELLVDNIKLNDCDVVFLNVGVGERPGTASCINDQENNCGMAKLVPGTGVEVLTVDNIVKTVDCSVAVIKIDVEGGEIEAIKGALNTIKEDHPIIYVETDKPEQMDEILFEYFYTRLPGHFNHTPTYLYV